jgi:hypothetical protein
MLHPEGLGLIQEFSEPLMVVAKDKPPQERFPRHRPQKSVVSILRYIYTYNQILLRTPHLSLDLTESLQPVTIQFIHKKPPLRI